MWLLKRITVTSALQTTVSALKWPYGRQVVLPLNEHLASALGLGLPTKNIFMLGTQLKNNFN